MRDLWKIACSHSWSISTLSLYRVWFVCGVLCALEGGCLRAQTPPVPTVNFPNENLLKIGPDPFGAHILWFSARGRVTFWPSSLKLVPFGSERQVCLCVCVFPLRPAVACSKTKSSFFSSWRFDCHLKPFGLVRFPQKDGLALSCSPAVCVKTIIVKKGGYEHFVSSGCWEQLGRWHLEIAEVPRCRMDFDFFIIIFFFPLGFRDSFVRRGLSFQRKLNNTFLEAENHG